VMWDRTILILKGIFHSVSTSYDINWSEIGKRIIASALVQLFVVLRVLLQEGPRTWYFKRSV